jgi:hypothetical protein
MMKKTSKMYASGGKLKMVEGKDGKEVPFFAADGEGKMKAGGMVPNTKGYFRGGRTMPGLGNPNQPKGKFGDMRKGLRKRPGHRPGAKRGGKG